VKLLQEALGQISGSDYEDLVKERIHHRMRDDGIGMQSMRKCHEAAYVAAFFQAAPTMVDATELVDGEDVHTAGAFHAQMKDIYGPGSFDGGKVDLRRWLDNAPAEDHDENAVPPMQQELVAAINSIKGKVQADLEQSTN
jgi:hypothetical protein